MALTTEILRQQSELTELTDEQVSAIVALSTNDEQQIIDRRIREIYDDLDKDIKETFGKDKRHGEKTYDYLKRVGQEVIAKVNTYSDYKKQVQALQTEKEELEQKMKDGKGTEAITQKLKDTEDKLNKLQSTYEQEVNDIKAKLKEKESEVKNVRVGFEFDRVLSGLDFKPEISDGLKKFMIRAAKDKLTNDYEIDFIEQDGQQQMVFRKNGEIVYNKAKGLTPYTAQDLLTAEIGEALKTEDNSGTGSKPPKDRKNDIANLGSVKTQVEADEIIKSTLLSQGIAKGSEEYLKQFSEIRKEHGVEKLPTK